MLPDAGKKNLELWSKLKQIYVFLSLTRFLFHLFPGLLTLSPPWINSKKLDLSCKNWDVSSLALMRTDVLSCLTLSPYQKIISCLTNISLNPGLGALLPPFTEWSWYSLALHLTDSSSDGGNSSVSYLVTS